MEQNYIKKVNHKQVRKRITQSQQPTHTRRVRIARLPRVLVTVKPPAKTVIKSPLKIQPATFPKVLLTRRNPYWTRRTAQRGNERVVNRKRRSDPRVTRYQTGDETLGQQATVDWLNQLLKGEDRANEWKAICLQTRVHPPEKHVCRNSGRRDQAG